MSNQKATTVSKMMTKKIVTVGSSSTAQDVAKKMNDKQVSSILVIDDRYSTPLGIVTERDLSRKVCVSDRSSRELLASQVMSFPLVTINANSTPSEAANLMLKNKVRHLLVVTSRYGQDEISEEAALDDLLKPVGIITPMDFIRYKITNTSRSDKDNDEDNDAEKILDYYGKDLDLV